MFKFLKKEYSEIFTESLSGIKFKYYPKTNRLYIVNYDLMKVEDESIFSLVESDIEEIKNRYIEKNVSLRRDKIISKIIN